jgi:energy-coupling factor transporter ATP-binding protein EcfA2
VNTTIDIPTSIVRVDVEKLFGRYTYSLCAQDNDQDQYSRLLVLYGDNGSGKTTILKLLFHLLSPSISRGHRSFLARVPFHSFSAHLADGTIITAHREEDIIGSFQFLIIKNNKVIATTSYEFDEEKENVKGEDEAVLKHLRELDLVLFFLGDNRVLGSDIFDDESASRRTAWASERDYREYFSTVEISSRRAKERNLDLDFALNASIERTKDWARKQVLTSLNSGVANVHSIYEDIITRIITSGDTPVEATLSNTFNALVEELKSQEARSKEFSRFGLASPLRTEKLTDILQSIDESKKLVVWNILKPYLDSVVARLDALQETQDALTIFVNTANEFLRDKDVYFNVRDGLSILVKNGQGLVPEKLSSGEKQLLLLLCNTLTARDSATVFIIDEPEISLNIKWQRNLVRALLDCTKGSQVQFLLATHSIELLSRYRSRVVKLEDQIREAIDGD